MGFISLVNPMRDLSSWKKILDFGINSNIVSCFATNATGRIVLFEKSLTHKVKLPVQTLSMMPVRDLLSHLSQGGIPPSKEKPGSDDLYSRKDFPPQNDQGTLIWWGFPLGTMPPPGGIYFLKLFLEKASEKQIETIDYPEILHMKNKIETAVAHHLLEESDHRVLHEKVEELMEWEAEGFKTNRVLLVDGVTLDESQRPVYLQFDGSEDALQMSQEPVSGSDIHFFKRISEFGARPALIEHTEKKYRYEIMLPLTWHVHIMGWIGIPFPQLELWAKQVRYNYEEIVRNLGDDLGEERAALGLLPKYDVHRGLVEEKSFLLMIEGMMLHHPPRPFVVILLECDMKFRQSLQEVLDQSKRPSDVLAEVGEDLVILLPDQDISRAKGFEDRYREILEQWVADSPSRKIAISVYWFPSTAWSPTELIEALCQRPKIQIEPKAGDSGSEKRFDEWLKRFILLKDWE